MMKITLLCLVATLFISPVFADVHKWKDAEGKTHYGDAPPLTGSVKVRTDEQTDDQIANGERIKAETAESVAQDKMEEANKKRAQAKEKKAELERQHSEAFKRALDPKTHAEARVDLERTNNELKELRETSGK